MVAIEPSCPVDIACSMSSTSAPRTSPTITRSGRIRKVLRNSSRCVTSPLPSTLGGRVSRRKTWGCCKANSAASSIVMMRWSSGMKVERQLSKVVLPLPVPPLIRMFSLVSDRDAHEIGHLLGQGP